MDFDLQIVWDHEGAPNDCFFCLGRFVFSPADLLIYEYFPAAFTKADLMWSSSFYSTASLIFFGNLFPKSMFGVVHNTSDSTASL